MKPEEMAKSYADRSPLYKYPEIYKLACTLLKRSTQIQTLDILDRKYPDIQRVRDCQCPSMRERVKCKFVCRDAL